MLPDKIAPYAKAIVAILGAVVVAVMQAWPDDPGVQQWGGIVTSLLTAIAVYAVPNKDPEGEHQDESVQPPEPADILPSGAPLGADSTKPAAPSEGSSEGSVWIDADHNLHLVRGGVEYVNPYWGSHGNAERTTG